MAPIATPPFVCIARQNMRVYVFILNSIQTHFVMQGCVLADGIYPPLSLEFLHLRALVLNSNLNPSTTIPVEKLLRNSFLEHYRLCHYVFYLIRVQELQFSEFYKSAFM